MPDLNVYTSTGSKLIHHPKVVQKWKQGYATPISLQLAPTSRCNLKCSFCSNVHRESHEDLDFNKLVDLLPKWQDLGMKTVEITGGGDPTLYRHINELIEYIDILGLEMGMISNGVLLKDKIKEENLNRLKWLRISMNCLEFVDSIDIPDIKGTLGFSLVWHKDITFNVFSAVRDHAAKYDPAYVRIVTDCLASDAEQEESSEHLSQLVARYGSPFMYQPKIYKTPKECWWGYFKPFLLHDGWVYPCSSVVLNTKADRSFHEKYRLVRMENLVNYYFDQVSPVDTQLCDRCVFFEQNKICAEIRNPNEMVNFV